MSCFVEFGDQTSKNVHDIRKMCLETTLCVSTCFVEVYVLVLGKNHVIGAKIIYVHVWVGKVRAKIPKDHPRVLEEGP